METLTTCYKKLFLSISLVLICFIIQTICGDSDDAKVVNDVSWCYHCMTPFSNVKEKNKDGVELALRSILRTLPNEETQDCAKYTNVSLLPVRACPDQYCFKYVVDDKDGSLFVVRLCVDQFKSYDPNYLKEGCSSTTVQWRTTGCLCKGNLCNESVKVSYSLFTYCLFVIFCVVVNILKVI